MDRGTRPSSRLFPATVPDSYRRNLSGREGRDRREVRRSSSRCRGGLVRDDSAGHQLQQPEGMEACSPWARKLPVCLLPRHSRRAEAETGRSSIRSQSKADKHNQHGLGKELRGHPKRSFRPSRGRNGSLAGACPQSGGSSSSSSSPGGKEGKQEARKFLKQQQPPQKEVEKERPAKSLTFKQGLDRRGSRS